jgi:RNA polymerase sigma factor (sigma-70 family)
MSFGATATDSTELAFERAYDAYWADVFRFALAWTNDWATAEDVAQDTFAQLWSTRRSLDWSRPVMPWLLRVARNKAIDRFRAIRRRFDPRPSQIATRDPDRDVWLDVRAAMNGLTNEERTALVSTAVLGLSPLEVAEVLGMTDGAVRAAASRARKKLEKER